MCSVFLLASIFLVGNIYTENNDILGNDNMESGNDILGNNNDILSNDYGFLSPMTPDAYGPGIHSDATDGPFKFNTFDGYDVRIFKVEPIAYGLGLEIDEFGRPVQAMPLD